MKGQTKTGLALVGAIAVAGLAACDGQIGSIPGASGTPGGEKGGTGRPGSAGSSSGTAFGAAPASLKRLRVAEYQSSIRDLLGDAIVAPVDLDSDLARGGYTTISAAVDPYSSSGIEKFETAAYDVAAQVFKVPGSAAKLVGCQPTASSDPCIAAFVATFGRRAWRRPLSADEIAKWTGVVSSVAATFDGNIAKGLEYVLAGLLQSPNFLYRADIGEPDGADRRRYTAYEMASRLSYTLWETTPDSALLDAAESGSLSTDAGVGQQTERMLADARSKPAMLRFFTELLHLGDLTTAFHPKNAQVYPSVSDSLYAAMQTEMQMNASDLIGSGQNVLDLFTARSTYVNDALAAFYGMPAPSGSAFAKGTLPAGRVGYLTSGAFLAINAHAESTSPTRRGVYILQNVLCRTIPPPPPNVNTSLPADTGQTTTRQRLEAHRSNPSCAACHGQFDPVGVTFEHFDAMGAYRDKENGLTIDTSGALNGTAFSGPDGLVPLLHESQETARCLVTNAYRYNTGHNIVSEADGEGTVIDGLAADFAAAGNSYEKLMATLARSAAFRYAVGQY